MRALPAGADSTPRLLSRLLGWWRARSRSQQVHAVVLLLITVGAVAHQVVLWDWYIEDAAISFAYARNWAAGEGLVPFVGGERVEGYSNPTWVALLALFEWLGWSAEASARWLQAVLAGATVPLVYLLAREAQPREGSAVPLLAAAVLAGNAQFAIWGASGLENALFNFLLAGGLWRLAVEARTGAFPWSGAWFFGVAISRPEAIGYAAVGGAGALVFSLQARRGLRPVLRWLAVFGLPFLAYHAARYAYFAYPWPMTYYGKIGDHREPRPLQWDRRGWRYVRDWARDVGMGYFLPVFVQGLVGGVGWRAVVGVGATAVVALTILLPGDQRLLLPVVLGFSYVAFYAGSRAQVGRPHPGLAWAGLGLVLGFIAVSEALRAAGAESNLGYPGWLQQSPPYVLALVWLGLPLVAAGPRGWQARWACWGASGVAVFFACYALGDWMKGFRWLSMLAVPGSVILACGLGAVGDMARAALSREEGRGWGVPGWVGILGLLGGYLVGNIAHSQWFEGKRETSPYQVKARVDYMSRAAERLHIDERIVNLDVDQGAHLWWSDWRMLDIAGLIDVPMAQHRFRRAFLAEYLFEEQRPHFAHVHGNWAKSSRIPSFDGWKNGYVEIPGYPAGRHQLHVGNHVRRDLLLRPGWEGTDGREARFDGGVVLRGWEIPSPVAAAGGRFYLEVGVQADRPRKPSDRFRLVAFLRGEEGQLASWELPVGYDWVFPEGWRSDEVFHGRFTLDLPPDLATGSYDLGFLVLGRDGGVQAADGASEEAAWLAVGEHRAGPALRVVNADEAQREADGLRQRAVVLAGEGACAQAEAAWFRARMHVPGTDWIEAHREGIVRVFADCQVALAAGDPTHAVAHLERAREWDRWAPSVRRAARPVADRLYAEGVEARAREDWEAAYRAFADAVRVDPSRSWARRYAEEARAYRLGHDPGTRAREEAERAAQAERLRRQVEAQRAKNAAPGDR